MTNSRLKTELKPILKSGDSSTYNKEAERKLLIRRKENEARRIIDSKPGISQTKRQTLLTSRLKWKHSARYFKFDNTGELKLGKEISKERYQKFIIGLLENNGFKKLQFSCNKEEKWTKVMVSEAQIILTEKRIQCELFKTILRCKFSDIGMFDHDLRYLVLFILPMTGWLLNHCQSRNYDKKRVTEDAKIFAMAQEDSNPLHIKQVFECLDDLTMNFRDSLCQKIVVGFEDWIHVYRYKSGRMTEKGIQKKNLERCYQSMKTAFMELTNRLEKERREGTCTDKEIVLYTNPVIHQKNMKKAIFNNAHLLSTEVGYASQFINELQRQRHFRWWLRKFKIALKTWPPTKSPMSKDKSIILRTSGQQINTMFTNEEVKQYIHNNEKLIRLLGDDHRATDKQHNIRIPEVHIEMICMDYLTDIDIWQAVRLFGKRWRKQVDKFSWSRINKGNRKKAFLLTQLGFKSLHHQFPLGTPTDYLEYARIKLSSEFSDRNIFEILPKLGFGEHETGDDLTIPSFPDESNYAHVIHHPVAWHNRPDLEVLRSRLRFPPLFSFCGLQQLSNKELYEFWRSIASDRLCDTFRSDCYGRLDNLRKEAGQQMYFCYQVCKTKEKKEQLQLEVEQQTDANTNTKMHPCVDVLYVSKSGRLRPAQLQDGKRLFFPRSSRVMKKEEIDITRIITMKEDLIDQILPEGKNVGSNKKARKIFRQKRTAELLRSKRKMERKQRHQIKNKARRLRRLHRLRQQSANRLVIADVVSALVNTVSDRGIIHADPVKNLTTGLVYYSVPRRTTKNQGETKHDNRPDSADNTPSRVRSRTVVVAEMTSTMVENNQVTLSQASLTPCPKIWDRISRQPSFDSTQSINDGSVLAGLYKSYQLEVLDSTEKIWNLPSPSQNPSVPYVDPNQIRKTLQLRPVTTNHVYAVIEDECYLLNHDGKPNPLLILTELQFKRSLMNKASCYLHESCCLHKWIRYLVRESIHTSWSKAMRVALHAEQERLAKKAKKRRELAIKRSRAANAAKESKTHSVKLEIVYPAMVSQQHWAKLHLQGTLVALKLSYTPGLEVNLFQRNGVFIDWQGCRVTCEIMRALSRQRLLFPNPKNIRLELVDVLDALNMLTLNFRYYANYLRFTSSQNIVKLITNVIDDMERMGINRETHHLRNLQNNENVYSDTNRIVTALEEEDEPFVKGVIAKLLVASHLKIDIARWKHEMVTQPPYSNHGSPHNHDRRLRRSERIKERQGNKSLVSLTYAYNGNRFPDEIVMMILLGYSTSIETWQACRTMCSSLHQKCNELSLRKVHQGTRKHAKLFVLSGTRKRLDTEILRGCRQLLQNGAYCSCTPHGGDESNTVIVCNHKIEWPMGTPSEFLSFVREQLWWTKEVTENNVDTLASSGQSLQQLTDKEIFDYLFGWERSRNGHNTNIEPGKAECLCFKDFTPLASRVIPSSASLQVYKALGPMFLRYKDWRRRLVANKDFKKNVQKRKCFDALASWNRKLYTKEMDAHMVYHNQSDEEDEDEELPSKNFRLKLSVQKKSNDKDKNQQEKGEPTATSAAKECSSQNDDTKKKDPTYVDDPHPFQRQRWTHTKPAQTEVEREHHLGAPVYTYNLLFPHGSSGIPGFVGSVQTAANYKEQHIYYDPIFSAQAGTVNVEILADIGCIQGAPSVMAQSLYEKIKRQCPNVILRESTVNNHVKMKAAGNSTMSVVNTVTIQFVVAHEQEDQPGKMVKHVIKLVACVVPNLARPFIMSNKDMSHFDHYGVDQSTGHFVFRNKRDETGRKNIAGTMQDDLRIPLSLSARRVTTNGPVIKRLQRPTAVRAGETFTLAPKTSIFYQVPILNASLDIPNLPAESKTELEYGSDKNPLVMELDQLEQSKYSQYMVTALEPVADETVESTKAFQLLQFSVPWTVDTLIDAEEAHLVRLENRTNEPMTIHAGHVIAYVQRIEDTYQEDEVGCVGMDIGMIFAEENKSQSEQESPVVSNINGSETEPLINGDEDDLPLPKGEQGWEKEPYPWMLNMPMHKVKNLPNYRAPEEVDMIAMRESAMWLKMHETDVWKKASVDARNDMETMLLDYSFLFTTRNKAGTVPKDMIMHDIELVRPQIIRCKQYPLTKHSRDEISKWVREMLANGFIESSKSPFRSPLLVVAKLTSDGKVKGWRCVFDARRLNAATKSYPGNPPPNTNQIFADLAGGQLFSTTDFSAGFYNVSLTDRAKAYTAFADPTDGRLFQFKRMAMGLVGSPATFAALGSMCFHDLISLTMQIYVDDIIVYTTKDHIKDIGAMNAPHYDRKGSSTAATKNNKRMNVGNLDNEETLLLELHRLQLEATFQRCCKAGLLLALKKTEVALRKVNLLGHEVSQQGLRPCRLKVAAMELAESPKDVSGVRRALGCFGFYRRFIPRFTQGTVHIRKMLKKGVKFDWTPEMEKEYVDIKNVLSAAPLVQPPDYSRQFYVMTDGSKVGLAGVVYQVDDKGETERVIGYWSRACTSAEGNYDSRELETLAVLGCIHKYKSILPTKFILYTDHLNLLKLSTYVSHKTRLSSWANRLSVYQPEIRHIPGKKNLVADWLSRAPYRPSNCPMITCITQAVEGIDDVQSDLVEDHSQYVTVKVTKDLDFQITGQEEQQHRWLSLMKQEAQVPVKQRSIQAIQSSMGKVFNLEPVKPSKSVRSRKDPPKRLSQEAIKKSQQNDARFKRILWYYDLGPRNRNDDRRCIRALESYHKRFEENASIQDKENQDNCLGPFKDLGGLRQYAALFFVDEKECLRLKKRPRTGALSRTKEGFKEGVEQKDELQEPPLCVGKSLQEKVLWWFHDSLLGNHQGKNHTTEQIVHRFYWPTMVNDVKIYCESCLRCRKAKQMKRERWRNIGVTPSSKGLYHTIFLDCVCISSADGGVTSHRNNTHILSIQDRLSGHCSLIPIRLHISDEQRERRQKWQKTARTAKGKRKADLLLKLREDARIIDERSAVVVAVAMYERICLTLHKKPQVIITDNGTEFRNALLAELSKLMNIRLVSLAPENARANYVERIHSMVGQRLKILTNDSLFPDKKSWDRYLPYIQHSLNSRFIVDRITPANVVFGRCDMLLVDELDKKIAVREAMSEVMPNDRKALIEYAHAILKRQEEISTLFGNEILRRQEQIANRFERKKKYHEYQIGDFVLLHRKNVGSKHLGSSSKLNLKWSGPHVVVGRVVGADVYKLQLYNSPSTVRAGADLLAPLSKHVIERPMEKTLWSQDLPRCAADLFPVTGDKMILIGLPKFMKATVAKIKKGIEFYVVEFQRKIQKGDDCESWEVVLMGNIGKRSASKTIASNSDPINASHYPAWSQHVVAWDEISNLASAKFEVKYGNADLSSKGFSKMKLLVTDETILPILPFQLKTDNKIPKMVLERISSLLEHRVKEKKK